MDECEGVAEVFDVVDDYNMQVSVSLEKKTNHVIEVEHCGREVSTSDVVVDVETAKTDVEKEGSYFSTLTATMKVIDKLLDDDEVPKSSERIRVAELENNGSDEEGPTIDDLKKWLDNYTRSYSEQCSHNND